MVALLTRVSRQKPHLPQRAGPVQPLPAQLLAGRQQLRLVGDLVREHADVLSDVKGRVIDPQRPAQPPPWHVQPLPEPGKMVQPAADCSRTASIQKRPPASDNRLPSRMASAPMSCGQPKSSGHTMLRSCALNRSITSPKPGQPTTAGLCAAGPVRSFHPFYEAERPVSLARQDGHQGQRSRPPGASGTLRPGLAVLFS
jgi:hypothetical protein